MSIWKAEAQCHLVLLYNDKYGTIINAEQLLSCGFISKEAFFEAFNNASQNINDWSSSIIRHNTSYKKETLHVKNINKYFGERQYSIRIYPHPNVNEVFRLRSKIAELENEIKSKKRKNECEDECEDNQSKKLKSEEDEVNVKNEENEANEKANEKAKEQN